MNRYTRSILCSLVAVLLFCQCGSTEDQGGYGKKFPMTEETFATIDSCMEFMNTDPARSHRMLDSVRQAGILSPKRCEYLHAMVVYTGDQQPDSALLMCDRLLADEDFGDDQFLEEEICVLAANLASVCNHQLDVLKYANRGIAICHGQERMRGDEATLMGRVGAAEQMLGRVDDARQTYARAAELLREDHSFNGLISTISLKKKQAGLCCAEKDYDGVIRICHEVLGLVRRFDRDPSFVKPRPQTMHQSGRATREFAEFYECQVYAHLARAYRLKVEQGLSARPQADRDSARYYIDCWLGTPASGSPQDMLMVLDELYFTGHRSEFSHAVDLVTPLFQGDSLNTDYEEVLTLLARDAADRHDLEASNAYLWRALAVSDSVRQQDLLRTFSDQLSLNMLQEEQLARQDAENQLARNRLYVRLLLAIIGITVVATSVILLLWRLNRKEKEIIDITQQDLTESQEEFQELAQQFEEGKIGRAAQNSKALYERIEQVMREKELYLNPDLDIRMLAEEVCSSRTLTSVSVNSVTGKPFRQWLSEYRLSLFVKMLAGNPDAPIDELLSRCGYKDQSTFRRQFKAAYGITAGEYRKRLKMDMTGG